ncbi:unnamed protein product [Cyprideis torosa]|uniref:Uncharacterized protein n=1 Tax=Cyprideis torosa TaxID=163714 RepID=A0A7R8WF41_9CRUS|nr:unnamed protein product [Cyprideis torosa]CAG0891037.1 unnamed protein product [Cyprideis torosa]
MSTRSIPYVKQRELFRVLKSYALLFPRDGYCQGQAPLAATLLMHMPAEHAFWCLVAMCERYLTRYFAPGLHQLQVDSEILMALLKKTDYAIYKHLKSQQITPLLFMTDWFMCVYSRTLPWESVLRIWDSFFFDGPKVLFVVAITLMRISVGSAKIRKECPSLYETISRIRNIDPEELIPQHLLPRLRKLHLESTELRRVNQKILLKRKKEAAANAAASTKNTPTAPRNGLTQTPPSAQASSLSTSSSSVHQSPNNNLGGYGALPHHPTVQQIQQQPPLKVHGLGQLLETPL